MADKTDPKKKSSKQEFDLKSLADGGARELPEIRAAHDAVAHHSPTETARLRELYLKSQQYLLPTAIGDSVRRLIEDDLRAVNALIQQNKSSEGVSTLLLDRVQRTERYFADQSEARALRNYVRGLVVATSFSLALLGIITAALVITGQSASGTYATVYHTVAAIGSGAAGAAVSVLLRKTDLIGEIDDNSLRRGAQIRVALGCLFAAAVVFLIQGRILTVVAIPAPAGDDLSTWFFWAGIGFLAGFNERWVRHLITREPDSEPKERKPANPAPEPLPDKPEANT